MGESELLEIARLAMVVMLKVSGPILLAGLAVGLVISLFQAVTQIQEQTLTFVPKILVVFVSLLLLLPFMLHSLMDFFRSLMERVATGS